MTKKKTSNSMLENQLVLDFENTTDNNLVTIITKPTRKVQVETKKTKKEKVEKIKKRGCVKFKHLKNNRKTRKLSKRILHLLAK